MVPAAEPLEPHHQRVAVTSREWLRVGWFTVGTALRRGRGGRLYNGEQRQQQPVNGHQGVGRRSVRRVSAGRGNAELVEQAERQEAPEVAVAASGQSNDILNGTPNQSVECSKVYIYSIYNELTRALHVGIIWNIPLLQMNLWPIVQTKSLFIIITSYIVRKCHTHEAFVTRKPH